MEEQAGKEADRGAAERAQDRGNWRGTSKAMRQKTDGQEHSDSPAIDSRLGNNGG